MTSCLSVSPWRVSEPPWNADSIAGARAVRVTLADDTTVALVEVEFSADGSELTGMPESASSREATTIPIDQILRLETRRLEAARIGSNFGLGVLYTFVIITALIFAVVPL